jgi:fibronectin type 3 domain-containing protein
VLTIVAPLPTPEGVVATNARDAVQLDWHAAAPEFRILRKLAEEENWAQIATTNRPTYLDATIEYGKKYDYLVQSVQKVSDADYAESELSDVKSIAPEDKFAPAVPVGVSAVPGTRNIEVVWDRNTEKDFASYKVYRDGVKIADGLTAPTYSDRDVKQGVTYRYQVTSVDAVGNESEKSPPVESSLP